jgi:hypothetical protein
MLWFWEKCLESNETTHDFLMENELQLDESIQAEITERAWQCSGNTFQLCHITGHIFLFLIPPVLLHAR